MEKLLLRKKNRFENNKIVGHHAPHPLKCTITVGFKV